MSNPLATDRMEFPFATSSDVAINTVAGNPLSVFLFHCLGILKVKTIKINAHGKYVNYHRSHLVKYRRLLLRNLLEIAYTR